MIQFNRETFEFLAAESIQEIHCAALDILEEIDIKERVVKFPPEIVEAWIRKAPSQCTWHGRNPEKNLTARLTKSGRNKVEKTLGRGPRRK